MSYPHGGSVQPIEYHLQNRRYYKLQISATMKTKKIAAACYLTICLILATVEPNESVSIGNFLSYYGIVLINLATAVLIINRLYKRGTTTTTNGN